MKSIIRDVLIVGLAAPIVLFLAGTFFPRVFEPIETAVYDVQLDAIPLAPRYLEPIVIADIDDRTIDELGDPEIWPRTYYSRVIDYLGGARLIGLYLPFHNSDRVRPEQVRFFSEYYGSSVASRLRLPADRGSDIVTEVLSSTTLDPELGMSIKRHGRVFLSFWATDTRAGKGAEPFPVANKGKIEGREKLPLDMIKHDQFICPIEEFVLSKRISAYMPLESLKIAKGMGFGEFYPDQDGVVRSQPLFIHCKKKIPSQGRTIDMDLLYPSFALVMAMDSLGAMNTIEVVTGGLIKVQNVDLTVESGARLRYLKPKSGFTTVSYIDVYNKKVNADEFNDKVVFIGSSAVNFGPLPPGGVREQAVVFANIVNGFSVSRSPRAAGFFLTMLLGVGMAFAILRYRPALGIPAAAAGVLLYLAIGLVSFRLGRVWIELVPPTISLALVAVAGFTVKSASHGRPSRQLETILDNRVPPLVLKELVRQPTDLMTLKPAVLTLARAEIKNLSPLIPQFPEIANQVLEEFTSTIARVVFGHGGIVAAYLPGGLVASFGAPVVFEDHALRAATAAVEMRRKFSIIGARLQAEGRGVLELGVVLDTAEVLAGFFKPVLDYQVVGPALALIDGLATLNRRLKTTILVTQHTQDILKDRARFRVVLESGIAGPGGPVRVYELLRVGA